MTSQIPSVPDISAIVIAHDEGELVRPTLASLHEAVAEARRAGLEVECLAVLDTPDDATRAGFAGESGLRVIEVAHGDHGLTRNAAVARATGRYVAFLDGDDLWSHNWLVAAYDVCESDPSRAIAHPMVDWVFGEETYLGFQPDQRDPAWYDASLRVSNPWDQLCMTSRQVHLDHPYRRRDLEAGFAYLDWSWNLETVAAGLQHRSVPGTIHFKRRRAASRLAQARAYQALPFPSPLQDYAWPANARQGGLEG